MLSEVCLVLSFVSELGLATADLILYESWVSCRHGGADFI